MRTTEYIEAVLSNLLSDSSRAIIHGQWISILIAGTGIFATLLSDKNSNFPLLMSVCNYSLLSSFLLRTKNYMNPCKTIEKIEINDNQSKEKPHILWYLLAALLDVEANFLVIEAYNYTSITSVMLLDCFTIPCAMILSYIFLRCRYTYKHILGTMICLSGLACIVINDSTEGDTGDHAILGDILCLSGSFLYASSNVLQEHLVKFHDRNEFIGNLGAFGIVIALIQFFIVDYEGVKRASFDMEIIFYIIGFVLCLFFMYINTSSFLQHSDSILFNLSLLTSDVYAVIFTFLFEGYLVSWLYFMAFALVLIGLIVYHKEKQPIEIGNQIDNSDDITNDVLNPVLDPEYSWDIKNKENGFLSYQSSNGDGGEGTLGYRPMGESSIDSIDDLTPT